MIRMGDNELGSILKGVFEHEDGRYVLCQIAELFSFRAGKQKAGSFGRQADARMAEELRNASVK